MLCVYKWLLNPADISDCPLLERDGVAIAFFQPADVRPMEITFFFFAILELHV